MPIDEIHGCFMKDIVSFKGEVALLGLDTNGALPQRIFGLRVETSIDVNPDNGEIGELYRLQASTAPGEQSYEDVVFADNLPEIERIIAGMVGSSLNKDKRILEGAYSAFHNSSQASHDPTVDYETCVNDLVCVVDASNEECFLKFQEAGTDAALPARTVASIFTPMTMKMILEMTAKTSELRKFRDDIVAAIEEMSFRKPHI